MGSNNDFHQKLANMAAYHQMLINSRLTALQTVLEANRGGNTLSMDTLLTDAERVEKYITNGLKPPDDPFAPSILKPRAI